MPLLKIIDLSLQVNLGCTAEERKTKQEVRLSFDLKFAGVPHACETDLLHDTLCYETICGSVQKVVSEKEFDTIEHLNQMLLRTIQRGIPEKTQVRIQVHKVSPPIPGLLGGVIFEQDA